MEGYFAFGPSQILFSQGRWAYALKPSSSAQEKKLRRYKQLLSQGSIINKGNYAVRMACEEGHLRILKFLSSECNIDFKANGSESVAWASCNGHFQVLKYLISQGVPYSFEKAIGSKNLFGLKLLLSRQIQADEKTVSLAVESQDPEIAKLVFAQSQGFTEMHLNAVDSVPILKLMLLKTFGSHPYPLTDISPLNPYYKYTMHRACLLGNLPLVQLLISKGLNINAEPNLFLEYASQGKHLFLVKYLISQGADPKQIRPIIWGYKDSGAAEINAFYTLSSQDKEKEALKALKILYTLRLSRL